MRDSRYIFIIDKLFKEYIDNDVYLKCIDCCDDLDRLLDIKEYIDNGDRIVKEYYEMKLLLLGGYSGENLNN